MDSGSVCPSNRSFRFDLVQDGTLTKLLKTIYIYMFYGILYRMMIDKSLRNMYKV